MAKPAARRTSRVIPVFCASCAVVVGALALMFGLSAADASRDVDSTTLGIGTQVSTVEDEEVTASSSSRVDVQSPDGSALSRGASRSITVSDPDPVIVISAVDYTNSNTVAAAEQLGTTDPLPTAPHILPDESDGWSTGQVSGYSPASCYDSEGNPGHTTTASGVTLTYSSLTVAMPESQSHLLGSAVAIRYGETIVVATVTDTGGFEGYGRALDLAPGVWQAFGASSEQEWGVRTVYYKFL